MPVRLLTLQTATPAASIALTEDDLLLAEFSLAVKRTHAEWLMGALETLLQEAGFTPPDIDGFGIVAGPGAFTSLRVGMATAKGMALATGRPLLSVSSLQTLAMQVPFAGMPVCAMLDARKREVYTAVFDWSSGRLEMFGEERVMTPERLCEELPGETVFIGEGAVAYRTLLTRRLGPRAHFAPAVLNLPRAATAGLLAYQQWQDGRLLQPEQAVPVYLRPAEAELHGPA